MKVIRQFLPVGPRFRKALLLLPCCAGILCGCSTVRKTDTPRTATEQLLLSTAADHATADFDLGWIKGKKTFVDDKYFDSYDKGYVISLIRQHLAQNGALLVRTNDQADVIVEIRSGALAINSSQYMFGIPSMALPIPFGSPLQTPEVAFYKNDKQDSIGKLAMFAYMRDSGEYFQAAGPVSGYSHYHYYKIIGISWRRTDVPQLKRHAEKKAGKEQEEKHGGK